MAKKLFKITCEFFVSADDEKQVENYLKEEAGLDFTESHLLIEEAPKTKEEPYTDLSNW